MSATATSKQSYRKLDEVKEMSQCDRIEKALEKSSKPLTVNELNETALADLSIPNGRVSARINKLRDEDKVVEAGKREDIFTKRTVKTWKVKGDSSTAVLNNGDNKECAEEEKASSVEPSNSSKFVTMEEAKEMKDEEDLSDLFVDDKQSDKLEAGELIWE